MARLRSDSTGRATTTKPNAAAQTIIHATRAQSGALPLFRNYWWHEAHNTIQQQKEEHSGQEDGRAELEGNGEFAARKPTPTVSTLMAIHGKVVATFPQDVVDSLADTFAGTLSYQNRKAARSLGRSTFWGWDLLAVFAIFGPEACTRRFLDTVKALSDVWDTRDAAWTALLEASTRRREGARIGTRAQCPEWITKDATLAKQNRATRSRAHSTSARSDNADGDGDDHRQQDGATRSRSHSTGARSENADEDGHHDERDESRQENGAGRSRSRSTSARSKNASEDGDERDESRQQDEGDGSERETEVARHGEQGERDDNDSEDDISFRWPTNEDLSFTSMDDTDGGLAGPFRLSVGESSAAELALGSDSELSNNIITQQRRASSIPDDIQSDLTHMSKRPAAMEIAGRPKQRRQVATALFPSVPELDVAPIQLDHGAQLECWLGLFRDTTTLLRLPIEQPFYQSITSPARYCILVPSSDDNTAQPETARLAAVALVTLERDAALSNRTRSRVRAFVPTQAETPSYNELLRGVTDFAREASTSVDSSMNNQVQDEEDDSVLMDKLPSIGPEAYSSALVAMATFYCAGHMPRHLTEACLDPTLWALMLRFAENDDAAADSLRLPSAHAFCQTSSESFIPEPSARRQTDYLVTIQQERARGQHIHSTLGLALSHISNLHDTCAALLWSLSHHLDSTSGPGAQAGAGEISEDDLTADITTAEQMIGHLQQRVTGDHASSDQKSVRACQRALEAQQRSLSDKQQQLALLRSRQAQSQRLQRCKDMLNRLLGHLALRQYDYANEKKHLEE
ncbi:hypothetical protein AC579_7152 [Pseudocercospora musae]|uniref:Uncharacterized protein n=1 Tax=Pseudocercospora musae TaxID=113226 RepID=A0A139GTP0_9PEZI|nr:hypothetical protein AC579_7152 [Pseudocercospora musae]